MACAVQEELAVRRQLSSLDWSQVQAKALAVLVEGFFSLMNGVTKFLPRPYADWPEHIRRVLYVDWWVLAALDNGVEPILPIRGIVTTAHLGGAALGEIPRRAKKHIGFEAGAFPLMAQAPENARALFSRLSRQLGKMARKDIPRHVREDPEFMRQADDAITLVLGQRLGQWDPLEAAVAGLDGQWNILPEAIGNVLTKDWHRRQRRDIEISFEDLSRTGDHLRGAEGDEDRFEPEDTQTPSPEEMAHVGRWRGLIEADPGLRLAWQYEVSGKTQEQFAKEVGRSRKTVSRHRKKLRRLMD